LPRAALAVFVSIIVPSLATARARADETAPIPVLARVPSKPYYVGQAIELRIGAEAAGERPEVILPAIPDTDVAPIDTSLSPLLSSGIGDEVTERNLFITRFRLIPRRAGPLKIPPVRVRLGARKGASAPLQIDVRSLPARGRPPEFLGGVGSMTVEAVAEPVRVRLGQDLSYTIRITGPAARGMTAAPDLARFAGLPLDLQIEPLSNTADDSPPSRRFRYRLRPLRPGEATLPPVSIGSFDPESGRYVVKVTAGIPIRVIDVPSFDPAQLQYPPRTPGSSAGVAPFPVARRRELGLLVGTVLTFVIAYVAWRRTVRVRADPRRRILRRARALDPREELATNARRITNVLVEYFETVNGRPGGALTPSEARSALADALHDNQLADRCAELVADCDRERFARAASPDSTLVERAREIFREIGRRR
jgi:hypothetical protein